MLTFLWRHRDVFEWSHGDMPGISPDVHYPDWITNVVLVKKANGKWRFYVDYSDSNKACLKDSFPLPRIDQPVDSTGYISKAGEPDVRQTDRAYYEVYVDDMLVKSIKESDHLADLGETFTILREYQMKLNPAKCAFGVGSGKLLGFQVSQRGIKANSDKIKALLDMLKGLKKAEWMSEYEQAFQQLKQYLGLPPLLSKPEEGEPLFLYPTVSTSAVSSALIREVGGEQHPIYYVSKAMVPVETRYPALEKLALSLIISARRLRPYFQAHFVVVLTNSPLKLVLQRPEVSEFTTPEEEEIGVEVEATPSPNPQQRSETVQEPGWVLYVDGSSNTKCVRAVIVLIASDSTPIQYAIRLCFKASNNKAEYEALLDGLKLAASLWVQSLQIPRAENSWADALAKLASATEGKIPRIIPVEFIEHPSINQTEKKTVNPVDDTPSWMDLIYDYLTSGKVPLDKLEARHLRVRAAWYVVLDGVLYKKGYSQSYLRCL
ncbi:uncharacterized protein LOC131224960 [Magnolia sinica]|uniref:uncharacterized protein LOC131224960 n=1 Tax=Magnolia sinica TaxID=86752 RepID=UPI002659A6CB|nr:uncharacterized protein LOC131224960 [Magnolia sinica]